MRPIMIVLLILCVCTNVHAQKAWELKKDQEGIKVYTASIPNSNLKIVKVTCVLNANLSQFTSLLQDTKAHEKWVYNTKKSSLVN